MKEEHKSTTEWKWGFNVKYVQGCSVFKWGGLIAFGRDFDYCWGLRKRSHMESLRSMKSICPYKQSFINHINKKACDSSDQLQFFESRYQQKKDSQKMSTAFLTQLKLRKEEWRKSIHHFSLSSSWQCVHPMYSTSSKGVGGSWD
jgi:hypothetical protein